MKQEFSNRVCSGVGMQPDGTIAISPPPFPNTANLSPAFQPPVTVPFSLTGQAAPSASLPLNNGFSAPTSGSLPSTASLSALQTPSSQPLGNFSLPASTYTTFSLAAPPGTLFNQNNLWAQQQAPPLGRSPGWFHPAQPAVTTLNQQQLFQLASSVPSPTIQALSAGQILGSTGTLLNGVLVEEVRVDLRSPPLGLATYALVKGGRYVDLRLFLMGVWNPLVTSRTNPL